MYTPLYFAQNMKAEDEKPGSPFGKAIHCCMEDSDGALEFISRSPDFLNPDYHGQFHDANQFLLANTGRLAHMGFFEEGSVDKGLDTADIRDVLLPYIIVNRWRPSKQVYRFDAELELALCDTEEVKVPVRILDRLPYRTMYFEFAEDGIFSSHFHGAFLTAVKRQEGYDLFLLRVTEDGRSMSGSCCLVPDPGDTEAAFLINRMSDINSEDKGSHVDWREFAMFLFNAILYLCSQNAEVRECRTTKKTYRPSARVRDKFSEVRQYECGYVFGETIRLHREEKGKERQVEKEDTAGEGQKPEPGSVRSIRPHMRKAHWHHYWTGKGRKELVLRWISPVAVGQGDVCATVRRVLP